MASGSRDDEGLVPLDDCAVSDVWARMWDRVGPGARERDDAEAERLREVRARCAESLAYFFEWSWPILEPATPLVMGRAVEAILEHLEAVARGEIRRLIINIPPGFSKSRATSVALPAWLWGPGGRPESRIISTSHDLTLAVRDNLLTRRLMTSQEYRDCWPAWDLSGDQNAKMRYENTRGGWRQCASVGSSLIGHRGDLLLIDDPHSPRAAESDVKRRSCLRWYGEELSTRLNDPKKSAIVLIMQRLHSSDLAGHILEKELGFEHLCVPMRYETDHPHRSTRWTDWRTKDGELADPVRFPIEVVEEQERTFRAEGGEFAVAGQYQQRPIPRGGGMFKESWFAYRDEAPDPSEVLVGPVRGWDLAATEDEGAAWTVGVKGCRLRSGETVVLDVVRRQAEPAEVYRLIRAVAERDGRACVQSLPKDPGQSGKDQIRHLVGTLAGFQVHTSPESGSKPDRARPLASQAEAGNLVLVRAPWNDDFVTEAVDFPRGKWLDQVDAASRMFARLAQPQGQSVPVGGRTFRLA